MGVRPMRLQSPSIQWRQIGMCPQPTILLGGGDLNDLKIRGLHSDFIHGQIDAPAARRPARC